MTEKPEYYFHVSPGDRDISLVGKPEIYARGVYTHTWFPVLGYAVAEKQADGVYWARPFDNPLVSLDQDFLWVDPQIRLYCWVYAVHWTPLPNGDLLRETTVRSAIAAIGEPSP